MLAQMSIGGWTEMGAPVCVYCKDVIRGPRLIYKQMWVCATCMYYLDRGEDPPQAVRA